MMAKSRTWVTMMLETGRFRDLICPLSANNQFSLCQKAIPSLLQGKQNKKQNKTKQQNYFSVAADKGKCRKVNSRAW